MFHWNSHVYFNIQPSQLLKTQSHHWKVINEQHNNTLCVYRVRLVRQGGVSMSGFHNSPCSVCLKSWRFSLKNITFSEWWTQTQITFIWYKHNDTWVSCSGLVPRDYDLPVSRCMKKLNWTWQSRFRVSVSVGQQENVYMLPTFISLIRKNTPSVTVSEKLRVVWVLALTAVQSARHASVSLVN